MSDDIHEVPSSTPNFKTKLAKQLEEIAPEAIADGKVDVAKLKELLDGDTADESERFGLFWPGKLNAIRAAQEPTTATLKPDPGLSKDWDTTRNVFIEGDNLEVLKILQKHYHGKIKMIYIDPPYNTGKDFVYPDNYQEGLQTYLEWTHQVNDEGKKVTTNTESDGRYHSHWLNMMYPRLKLARNLLEDDGVMFISIDDHEHENLSKICHEIFGEENVENIIWHKVADDSGRLKVTRRVRKEHEYILACYRNIGNVRFKKFLSQRNYKNSYNNPDNDPRGPYKQGIISQTEEHSKENGKNFYTVRTPSGKLYSRQWRFPQSEFETLNNDHRIYYGKQDDSVPSLKVFLSEPKQTTPTTLFTNLGTAKSAGQALIQLFEGKRFFDYPKPVPLINRLAVIACDADSLVLDFFSGSGPTAQAIMCLNAEDGGHRRHIQVQLPEPVEPTSAAGKAGFKTIADIARKRIDLAGEKIKHDYAEQLSKRDTSLDIGYRTYKLTDTNFAKWRVQSDVEPDYLEQRLLDLRENANDDSTPLQLLAELLIKQGYSLTEHVSPVDIAGLQLEEVGNNLVLAYLNEQVKPTLEQLRAVVDREPERVVILEDAFQGDDELKTNLVQLCKTKRVELWTA